MESSSTVVFGVIDRLEKGFRWTLLPMVLLVALLIVVAYVAGCTPAVSEEPTTTTPPEEQQPIPTPSSTLPGENTLGNLRITTSDLIIAIEAAILLATLIFIVFSFRRSDDQMRKQLQQLQLEVRRATHDALFDKLFNLYRLYIEHADDLGQLWSYGETRDTPEVKRQYMGLFILDFLYLMHVQWDNLEEGLRRTWYVWVDKVFEVPELHALYDRTRPEYDVNFIGRIETYRSTKQGNISTEQGGLSTV